MGIIEYLLDPNKVGTYYCKFTIPKSKVFELLNETIKFDESSKRQPTTFNTKRFELESRDSEFEPVNRWNNLFFDDLVEAVQHLSIYRPKVPPLGPWQIKLPFKKGVSVKAIRAESLEYLTASTRFDYKIFLERNQSDLEHFNAIHVESSLTEQDFTIEIFSVDKEGAERQVTFLKSIPLISEGTPSAVTQKFSSRFCFKSYPAAVAVWALNTMENPVYVEVLKYFLSAIHYFEESEWRISIVLSAIAVETVLAEIFEELMHDSAPPDTLGTLLHTIATPAAIPNDVKTDADRVNKARILAVHRNPGEIGETEALQTLLGAVRFAYWAYHRGPLSAH